MGAIIGGASKRDCDLLYGYGFNLGLAFQVADDYLDAFGDEKVFGKPIGGDIVNSKKSWLTIRAYEKASPEQAEELINAMSMPSGTDGEKAAKIAKVKELYSALGVAEDAQNTILELNSKALEAAAKVCKGVRYERLRRFADKLIPAAILGRKDYDDPSISYAKNPACVLGLINLYVASSGSTPQITFVEDPNEELSEEMSYVPATYVNADYTLKEGYQTVKVNRVLSYDRKDVNGTDHGRVE
jgi:hypothetical protein